MQSMLDIPPGPKVELRRWFTTAVAEEFLGPLWNTMLLALLADFSLAGEDPWAIAAKSAPVAFRSDDAAAR
eukprot:791852-Alexandrium_andersonii.AAC.1